VTEVDLDRLEDLHQSTTPGPWWDSPVKAAPGGHTIRGGPSDWRGFDGSLGGDTRPIARIALALAEDGGSINESDADAEFIVEAHRVMPGLVAELRAAREVVNRLPRTPCLFCGWGDHNPGCPLAAYDQAIGGGA
jgi:hypothetical protein